MGAACTASVTAKKQWVNIGGGVMTIRHMVTRANGIAFLVAAVWASAAPAAGQASASKKYAPSTDVILKDGGLLEFCEEGAECVTARHPIAAGRVRQIVPGDFISAATASWIAVSDRAVSLCYLGPSAALVTCTPVANGSDLAKGTQIVYVDLDDGTYTLKFTSKGGDRAAWEANFNPYPFMSAVSAAAEVLQKHAARHRSSNANYADSLLGGGANADVCSVIDGGGVACTSTGVEAVRDDVRASASRSSPPGLAAAPRARPTDPYAVATVNTGRSERPTFQACTNAVIMQMKECNGPRNGTDERAHRTCVENADANLQECMEDVRYKGSVKR
jgi:hypothetical protein